MILRPLLLACLVARPASAQSGCPSGELPAYAHNDYENARPLRDAVTLGYRGVEADVYLIGGTLRLGHEQRHARRGPSLEATYLAPMRELASRCQGRLLPDGASFLLNVELKTTSLAAVDSLVALLARYPELLHPGVASPASRPPVEVVLVGWVPPARVDIGSRVTPSGVPLRRQRLVRALRERGDVAPEGDLPVALVSIDYGKTIARRWRRDPPLDVWLARVAQLRRAHPDARVRVFNAPVHGALYARLLAHGVDLIGSEHLEATAAALRRSAAHAGGGAR